VNGAQSGNRKKTKPAGKHEPKLSPFKGYLKKRMEEGAYNTRKLLRELRERGYTGGLTQLILYLQPVRPQWEEEAVMRFETEPGQQAQVDWGSFGGIDREGRQRCTNHSVAACC